MHVAVITLLAVYETRSPTRCFLPSIEVVIELYPNDVGCGAWRHHLVPLVPVLWLERWRRIRAGEPRSIF